MRYTAQNVGVLLGTFFGEAVRLRRSAMREGNNHLALGQNRIRLH